jgi:molybdenum-dependent DNA-binding transcriptional regulator ModE
MHTGTHNVGEARLEWRRGGGASGQAKLGEVTTRLLDELDVRFRRHEERAEIKDACGARDPQPLGLIFYALFSGNGTESRLAK